MKVTETGIDGLVIVDPDVFHDARGWFCEQYSFSRYCAAGITAQFVQDNESMSSRGVIRGLHWQDGQHCQAKLVRVVRGAVFDVAIDIRAGSPTFGKYRAVVLCAPDSDAASKAGEPPFRQFYIPRGFAHGFAVLEDNTVFSYKCDNAYNKESERGIIYSDPRIGIAWPDTGTAPIVSDKDLNHVTLDSAEPYDWGLV